MEKALSGGGRVVGRQSSRDLLFLHQPISPERLRPLVPEPLRIDTYDRHPWITRLDER